MKTKAIIAALLVLAFALVAVAPMESDDGAITIEHESKVTFDASTGGIIVLKYVSDVAKPVTITVKEASSGEIWFSEKYDFISTGGQTETIEIPLLGPNSGTKTLEFTFSDSSIKGFNITVKYDAGFWSNWTVYAVIIVIIILVAALILLKSRTPKAKNTLTFEQIEAMKQAERESSAKPKTEKKAAGGSTERQKYLASKKKKD